MMTQGRKEVALEGLNRSMRLCTQPGAGLVGEQARWQGLCWPHLSLPGPPLWLHLVMASWVISLLPQ